MEGESSRAASMEKDRSKSVIAAKDVPDPTVDVTQVKVWASVNPNMLNAGTAVTHQNLQTLASMIQAMTGMLVDQSKKINKLTTDVAIIKDVLGAGVSGNTSRRSSMGSVGRRSSAGEITADEISGQAIPFDNVMEKLESLDGFFELFIQENLSFKPLVKRTKNAKASGIRFINAAKEGLSKALDDENTAAINRYLAQLDDSEMADVFIALSKRYRSNQSSGKNVATVTESFDTQVGDDNGGSQSTQIDTPRRTRSYAFPKTPGRRRDVILDSDDEVEVSLANTNDEDDTFQP
ncbi:Ff.00g132260.m01.CDS01 [Fusarium sp. VM40]|nr:Ff.00g132260.m01.CDS01 [Fusarium sp. VM40]